MALVVVLAGGGALGRTWMNYQAFLSEPLGPRGEAFTYVIPQGASLSAVAADLHRKGYLRRPRWLVWHARWERLASAIKAGEYRIAAGTDARGLLQRLVRGDVVLHALTLVEGWTFRQMRAAVEAHPHLEHTLAGASDSEIMARIGHPGVHPEGRFLAETYHFPRDTADVQFLSRAFRDMDRLLAEAWAGRAEGLALASPEEALILASIVEKETAVAEERPRIAGVFVRRLAKGMRLETDPTVIYGLGEAFDGNLRRRDLRRDTPYNTYLHKGLPPTPIAMPGAAAIRAVVHPELGAALFFVAKGDGTHHFSETYEEHRKAVARYQLGRRRKRSASGGDSG